MRLSYLLFTYYKIDENKIWDPIHNAEEGNI